MLKKEIRFLYKQKRNELTEIQISEYSKEICNLLFGEVITDNIQYLHTFVPIQQKKEVNTWFILQKAKKEYLKIKPVISRSDFEKGTLKHYLYNNHVVLHKNAYGIEEPVEGVEVEENLLDLIIIPLLAYDKKGHRVGYGKGFYDRFLRLCRNDAMKVGVSFFEPCELIKDTNNNDIALDICITPSKIYKF